MIRRVLERGRQASMGEIIQAIFSLLVVFFMVPGFLTTGSQPQPEPVPTWPVTPVEPDAAETVASFTLKSGGVETTLTYYAIDDVVIRQTTLNVVNYAEAGFANEAEAREFFEPLLPQFQGIVGLDHKFEFMAEQAIETMEIDYTVANIVEVSQLIGSTFSDNITEDSALSLRESRLLLLSQGYTEVL